MVLKTPCGMCDNRFTARDISSRLGTSLKVPGSIVDILALISDNVCSIGKFFIIPSNSNNYYYYNK